MRWQTKTQRPKAKWDKVFIWWPREIDNHNVWLEFVWRKWSPGYLMMEGCWVYSLRDLYY